MRAVDVARRLGSRGRHARPLVHGVNRRQAGVGLGTLVALFLVVFIPLTQSGPSASPAVSQGGCTQADPTAGCQGVVSALPATSSPVTVNGQGQYANLAVTVNQTKNLINQAVSVSWKGGTQTVSDQPGTFDGDYLQIFECWGDQPASNPPDPSDPGLLPSQCEVGGESPSSSNYPVTGPGFEYSRVVTQPGWSTYTPSTPLCTADPSTDTEPCLDGNGLVVQPFQSVDGTVVKQQADYNYLANQAAPLPFWLNSYFSFSTTNEIDFAPTSEDGTGNQLFQVDTGLEAPGLGCGQSVEALPGGGTTTPQCWLVVVPRSTGTAENPTGVDPTSVVTSPLTSEAWANRIAIPLYFNPVGSSCSINADSQQIIGSELASPAVANWEPSLCNLPGSPPFSYIQNNDDQARQNLTDPGYGSVGMSVFSDPIPTSETSPTAPVVYAPLTLSGVVIAFNIQRVPALQSDGTLQPGELAQDGSRVENLYLTPRLVAKLLTESYQGQLRDVTKTQLPGYAWAKNNPVSLFSDPDFLQYNPEFSLLSTQEQIDAGTLLVEEGSSDAASTLWQWVLSDPAAVAWLDGTPDPFTGMVVNPYYDTDASANPSGEAFAPPTPETYPKSDPYCWATGDKVYGSPPEPARPICVQDWTPYALSMAATAQDTAAANDGAKTTFTPSNTPNTAWTANGPQTTGNDLVISVTDSASAARYGLQTASLSAGGSVAADANPTFTAPTSAGILAGEQAMTPSPVPGVLQTNPSTTQPGAYPLAMLTYAATTPDTLDTASRQNYSAFLTYAAGAGQVTGLDPGDLPAGYVPLPAALAAQTLAAAATVLNPPALPTSATAPASGTSGSGGTSGFSSTATGAFSTVGPSSELASAAAAARARAKAKAKAVGPATLSAVRIEGVPIGLLRWALPILLLIGLGAALAALATRLTSLRRAATAGAPVDEGTPSAAVET
jgi:hypothetical protein